MTDTEFPELPAITDYTDKAQIDTYNRAVDTYSDAVDTYNEGVHRYNAEHGLATNEDATGRQP